MNLSLLSPPGLGLRRDGEERRRIKPGDNRECDRLGALLLVCLPAPLLPNPLPAWARTGTCC